MYCIYSTSTDIYCHLAAEEYLLKNRMEDFFMLWQSDRAVVLGKHQHLETEIDTKYVRQQDIRIARRYSGGGCVYHDLGNLNLTFIQSPPSSHFNEFSQLIAGFLCTLDIEAEVDSRMGLTVNGLKISGSAQCIYKNRSMYHCTLLYRSSLSTLNAALTPPDEELTDLPAAIPNNVRSVRSQVGNLCDFLATPPNTQRFKASLFNYVLHQREDNLFYNFSPHDERAILHLREKYASGEWIWKNIRQPTPPYILRTN